MAGLHDFDGGLQLETQSLPELSSTERARLIALVPQQLSLAFPIRIFDFVLNGRFPHLNWWGQYSKEDTEIARQSLAEVGMQAFENRYLKEISGGELQKVLLARAICQQTPVLLLDEPAQSLDPKNRIWLYSFLHQYSQKGKTIICTTHDLEALETPDARVLALKDGQIVYDGVGENLRKEWLMEEVYG